MDNTKVKRSFLSKEDFSLIKRAFKYLIPYKGRYVISFICISLNIGISLVQPYCFGIMVQSIVNGNRELLIQMAFYMLLAYILQIIIGYLQMILMDRLNNRIIFNIQKDLYYNIIRLPICIFDKTSSGEFLSRLTGDSAILAGVITGQFQDSIINVLRVIIFGFAAFSLSWQLVIVILISFPCLIFIFYFFGKKLRIANEKLVKLRDAFYTNTNETLSSIREVKAMNILLSKYNEFFNITDKQKSTNIKIGTLNAFMQSSSQAVNFLTELTVMFVGALLIFDGKLTIAAYVTFISYSSQFLNSLMGLTQINATIQRAIVSIRRIFHAIDSYQQLQEKFGTRLLESKKANIAFNNISFAYTKPDYILKDFSMEIEAGSKTAIVGNSGSGKTTLFNLLLRFYDPSKGSITIDSIDLRQLSENGLRDNIAYVRQEPHLFKETVKNNLLMVKPESTDDEIIQACRMAYIHDYIMSLPKQYDSMIGEKGINFSTGQKQRLVIARALLKGSNIILLDEATSALDNESQYEIKKALDNLIGWKTIIIIAHRLLTVIDADTIYVIADGKIAGKGKHSELLASNSIYQKLYMLEVKTISSTL